MRFSKTTGIEPTSSDDWFDPVLEQDSPLYIDPYLVFADTDPMWAGAYDDVVTFFETAAELVLASGGEPDTAAWRKAISLLSFPEPHEFALGLALGSPRGAGTGEVFAGRIAEVLALLGATRTAKLASIGGFALFCDGIGMDRISDIIGNILKSRFIAYTRAVIVTHQIPTQIVPVKNASWDATRARWHGDNVALVPNNSTQGGVLLVPRRFLKDIPRVEPEDFWNWASITEASALRDDLNYDLSESLTKSERVARARRVAQSKPELAIQFLDRIDAQTHKPYDVIEDPRGLVGWHEGGARALALVSSDSASHSVAATPAEFRRWVTSIAEDFRFVVENTDAWRLLWDDKHTRHRAEKIAQAVAGVMWRTQCQNANVDLNKETNIGRGPVDFKFSQGWQKRALLEVKFISSTHFSHGAEKQLPQYLASEQVDFGIYLAIGFKDADFAPARLKKVRDTCESLGAQMGAEVKLIVVDARPKASASNV